MPEPRSKADLAGISAMVAAATIIAQQVASKTTRDALFLSQFSVTRLPAMLIAAALMSVAVALVTARVMSRVSPARFVPWAFATSAALLLGLWALALREPALAAIGLFLHVAILGPVLISGYWSLFNESFDPRAAKRQIVRIGGVGTLGGVLGGVLADRVAAAAGLAATLPLLAALHVISAFVVRGFGPRAGSPAVAAPAGDPLESLRLLARRPYLRDLALLVGIGTIAAALLDYVFKAYATEAFGSGEHLVRVFSSFYVGVALFTFLIQVTLSRVSLDRLRVAETTSILPLAVIGGATGLLVAPGLILAAIARGLEVVVRNSFFRSGYELLYTPVAPEEKRATKAVVDVGAERLGDALGGVLVAAVLATEIGSRNTVLVTLALVAAVVGLLLTRRLHRGYVGALESNIVRGAVALGQGAPLDLSQTWVPTMFAARSEDWAPAPAAVPRPPSDGDGGTAPPASGVSVLSLESRGDAPVSPDLEVHLGRIAELHSADPKRVHAALATLTPDLVRYAIPLLAREEVAADAVRALRRVAPAVVGQLLDALLDPEMDATVRRRLPRVIGESRTPRAVQGLFLALVDPRFEIRQQSGRALARMRERAPDLAIGREQVIAAVLREVDLDRAVWEGRREMSRAEAGSEAPLVDAVLRERSDAALEHVFTVLSLEMGQLSLLRIALHEMLRGDAARRGTALEYLENVIPPEVKERLWPYLEEQRAPARPPRPADEIVAQLLQSHRSIRVRLDELRELGGLGPAPSNE